MLTWLKNHFTYYLTCLAAPILYHSKQNGYLINAYFTVLEMVDVYGVLILVFVFLGSLVFYRNSILQVFLTTKIINVKSRKKKKDEEEEEEKMPDFNRTRNLGLVTKSFRMVKFAVSPVFKFFSKKL